MAITRILTVIILQLFLLSNCASTKRGLLDENTYYSTFSPKLQIRLASEFKHQPNEEDKSLYEFYNRDKTKGVILTHVQNMTPENIVDYYYPPLTWMFSHITAKNQISTGKIEILGSTWYYCDSVFYESNDCGLVRFLGFFTHMHDVFYLGYMEALPYYQCNIWRDLKNLTTEQKKVLSSFHDNFDKFITIEDYGTSPAAGNEKYLHHKILSIEQERYFATKYSDPALTPHFKAFAIDPDGDAVGWSHGYHKPEHAIDTAMDYCQKRGSDCVLYAVGEKVIIDYSKEELAKYLNEHYEEILPPGDLRKIRKQALTAKEIKSLFQKLDGLGVGSRTGTHFTIHSYPTGRLVVEITKTPTSTKTGVYEGKWWVEGDRWCREIKGLFSDRSECQYLIKENNDISFYNENGAFLNTIEIISVKK